MIRTGGMMLARRLPWLALAASLLAAAFLCVPLAAAAQSSGKAQNAGDDISGSYTFLREGEYVQITMEDGKLSGYVSRFGDSEDDKGEFIDQFFDKASLNGDRLSFNTKTVHGTWYDFTGVITTVPGKKPADEGYRSIKGTLIQHTADTNGADKTTQRQVEFKSIPTDQ